MRSTPVECAAAFPDESGHELRIVGVHGSRQLPRGHENPIGSDSLVAHCCLGREATGGSRKRFANPVRPVKAGAFSGSESRQGKSQEPCSLSRR